MAHSINLCLELVFVFIAAFLGGKLYRMIRHRKTRNRAFVRISIYFILTLFAFVNGLVYLCVPEIYTPNIKNFMFGLPWGIVVLIWVLRPVYPIYSSVKGLIEQSLRNKVLWIVLLISLLVFICMFWYLNEELTRFFQSIVRLL